jgi:toxin ParE1/3/4
MVKYHVSVSKPAEKDLFEIENYIATQLLVPETARQMMVTFKNAISGLSTMPKRHPLVEDAFLFSLGYRLLPVKNYNIFYSVDDTQKLPQVNIERILYAGRDWANLLALEKENNDG